MLNIQEVILYYKIIKIFIIYNHFYKIGKIFKFIIQILKFINNNNQFFIINFIILYYQIIFYKIKYNKLKYLNLLY